jgi:thiol-disulfide isomerase/thioredoxin
MKKIIIFIFISFFISLELNAANIKLNFEENLIERYGIEEVIFYKYIGFSWEDRSQNIIEVIKLNNSFTEYSVDLEVDEIDKIYIQLYPLDQFKRYLLKNKGKYSLNIIENNQLYPNIELESVFGEYNLTDVYFEFMDKFRNSNYSDIAANCNFNYDSTIKAIKNLNKIKEVFIDSLLKDTGFENWNIKNFFMKKIEFDQRIITISNIAGIMKNEKVLMDEYLKYLEYNDLKESMLYESYPFDAIREFVIQFYNLKNNKNLKSLETLLDEYDRLFEVPLKTILISREISKFITFRIEFENIEKNGTMAENLINKYNSLIGDYATNYLLNELEKKRRLLPGSKIPQFQIEDTLGNFVEISNYLDKNTLIYIWTSWCTPCIQSFKKIEQYKEILNKNGFSLVLLSLDFDRICGKRELFKTISRIIIIFFQSEAHPASPGAILE